MNIGYLFSGIIFSLCIFSAAVSAQAADYPLEIIQPRAGLDTTNRFYKAYPGLEYNVRMAVIGGAYPFTYQLTTAPAGMTINSSTGEISWPNPTTSGSPHSVTARITDSESSQQTVSWTITVTTSGFYFIDAVNGSYNAARGGTGTGTAANPWKDMQDFYGGTTNISTQPSAKNDNAYAGGFVYFKTGTYESNAMPSEDGWRVPFVYNNKPQVWLAYPGHSPVISMAGAVIEFYSGGSNLYFDGLYLKVNGNTNARCVRFSGTSNDVTFVRNTFDGDGMVGTGGGNNALLFFVNSGTGTNNRISVSHNTFTDVGGGIGIEGYSAHKVLIEGNTATGIIGHAIYAKTSTQNWHIRGNKITNCAMTGVLVGNYSPSGDINISHNYINMNSGNAIHLNEQYTTTSSGPFRAVRNTVKGGIQINKVTTTNGLFHISNNVIINSASGDKLTKNSIDYPTNLKVSGSLGGTSGIINASGELLGEYSSYLGTVGWQFADGSTPMNRLLVGTSSPTPISAPSPSNLFITPKTN